MKTRGCTVSDRPICFKKYTPPPRLFRSPVCFFRRIVYARVRASFVARTKPRAREATRFRRLHLFRHLPFVTSITHVVSRRVRTNLTNKTSFKERGGDVENAPEKEGHSFSFYTPRDDGDDARTHARTHARRCGTEGEEHQSPSLSRCISLSTTGGNKRAVSRRSGASPEYAPRSVRNDSASVRFASSSSVC